MPGTITTISDIPVGSGVISATGKWFIVGETRRGPTSRYVIARNMSELKRRLGDRFAINPLIYDCADAFFADGGSLIVFGRVAGPAAVAASVMLRDATNANSLTVTADGPGVWANGAAGGLTVQVTHPSTGFAIVVRLGGELLLTTPEFASVTDAVAWSVDNPEWVTLTDPGATAIPAVRAATNLTGGNDDRANINTDSFQAALDLFVSDLGPGQVSAPGVSTAGVQDAVLDHCETTGRIPRLDGPNSTDPADWAAIPPSLTSEGKKRGAPYGPWAVIRGLTPSTTRQIPYSAIQAAMEARNDGSGPLPKVGRPVAGDNGFVSDRSLVLGLTVNWDRATRDSLDAAGVNTARVSPANNRVQTYGNRTMADADTHPAWVQAHAARVFGYAQYRGDAISEHYVHRLLDADNKTINEYGAQLEAFLEDLRTDEQIVNDPKTAVDTGPGVNTTGPGGTLARKELHAAMGVQPAGAADTVYLNIGAEA